MLQVWHSIGSGVTEPPPPGGPAADVFVPSQPFLAALVQIFPGMFQHIKYRSADRLGALIGGGLGFIKQTY